MEMATSVTGSSATIIKEPLGDTNYGSWKFKIQLILEDRGLWGYVDGSKPAPLEPEALAQWKIKDGQARAQIGLNVGDNQSIHVRSSKTSKEAWDALATIFEQKGLNSRVYLFRQLWTLRLADGERVQPHIAKLKDIVDKLANIGDPIKDADVALILLCSLGPSWDMLVTSLQMTSKITSDDIIGRLTNEEIRRMSQESALPSSLPSSSALVATTQRPPSHKVCTHCRKKGHVEATCWTKHGRPASSRGGGKPAQVESSNSHGFAANVAGKDGVGTTGTIMGSYGNAESVMMTTSTTPVPMKMKCEEATRSTVSACTWYLDSGASVCKRRLWASAPL